MTNQESIALVALGTNLPFGALSGAELLAAAVRALAASGLTPLARSGVWRTAPWPPSDQAPYYNAVVVLTAAKRTPQNIFEELLATERQFGRERRERWGPRTLDLDLLDLGGAIGTFGDITLPHKRLHERAFVLAPLAEAAPDWRHPQLGRRAADLLAALPPGQAAEREGAFPD